MATLKVIRKLAPDGSNKQTYPRYITQVVIAETGEPLTGIQYVEYKEDCKTHGQLILGTVDFELDLEVDKNDLEINKVGNKRINYNSHDTCVCKTETLMARGCCCGFLKMPS